MATQFVKNWVVTRGNCQEVVLRLTYQQATPLKMPRDALTERVHQQL